jgi:predicted Holliday junction resolvase-like endonuclease
MDTTRITAIRQRLAAVQDGHPWKYNPKHEMFIGTTNALEMYGGVLDLGRDGKEYVRYEDETGHGCRLTEASKRRMARIKALGEFLESCRADMEWLLREALGRVEGAE